MDERSQVQNTSSSFVARQPHCRDRKSAFYFSEQQGSQAKNSGLSQWQLALPGCMTLGKCSTSLSLTYKIEMAVLIYRRVVKMK